MGPSIKGKKWYALLVLFMSFLLPVIASAGITTDVVVNKSVLLNLHNPSERVSIATPAIAELVVISPTQLQINGTKIGSTSLIVWEKGGKTSFFDIRVKGDSAQLEKQIREMSLNDSITVDYANDTIILAGKAANEQTIAKAVHIASAYTAKEGGQSGGMATAPQVSEAPGMKVLNHIVVDEPQQVLLEVKVAQVDKSALKSLGISMQASGVGFNGVSNLIGAPDGAWVGTISPLATMQVQGSIEKTALSGVLKALAAKNMAKLLAEPNLLVKSGQAGTFLAGSKFYLPVVTNNTADTKEITVGVKLNFKPEVLENGLISLKIDPAEVSSIAGTLAVNGSPIIDTREIRTNVQLKNGESLVLGGLLQEETIKSMSKVPILGDIPILGALFRSTQSEQKEKELVFFITPKIVKPDSSGKQPKLLTEKPLTPAQEKELQWIPVN